MRKQSYTREIFQHDPTGENIITELASRGREHAVLCSLCGSGRSAAISLAYAICLRDARHSFVFSEAARVNAITRGRTRLRRCLHFG